MTTSNILESQIKSLQSQLANISAPQQDNIQQLVKEAVSSELAELKKLLTNQQAPAKKKITIFEAIGSALTQEQQLWLSKEEVISAVPEFLASEQGKEITKLFYETYRGALNET